MRMGFKHERGLTSGRVNPAGPGHRSAARINLKFRPHSRKKRPISRKNLQKIGINSVHGPMCLLFGENGPTFLVTLDPWASVCYQFIKNDLLPRKTDRRKTRD